MDQPVATRPRQVLLFMALPIALGTLLVGATVAWFATVQGTAGEAAGPPARLTFTGCPEADAAIEARLLDYGLAPRREAPGVFVVKTPGMDDDLAHLPAALAAPGKLEVRAAEKVWSRFDEVGVQLAFSGTPVTLLLFGEALPDDVAVTIDGAPVEVEQAGGVELQLGARGATPAKALRLATDRAVQLRHPLPCAVMGTASAL
ncbi:MAG: hypothetical protein ACOZNI_36660 [Myxococcota bacterium]